MGQNQTHEKVGALSKTMWGMILVIDLLVFVLGFFTGQISFILLAFVMTVLMDVLARRGLLLGFNDGKAGTRDTSISLSNEQRREIIKELRVQRKKRRHL